MLKVIIMVASGMLANIIGHSIWIFALANFAWMLFKDTTLFPWIWLLYGAIAFVICVVTLFISFVALHEDS